MKNYLTFQVSLFGHFIDITPRTDVMMKLLSELASESFIPNTVEVLKIDASTKNTVFDSRINMISEDKQWNIVFLEDRIDFNYQKSNEDEISVDIACLINRVKILIEKVFHVFPQISGNRLALNGCFISNERGYVNYLNTTLPASLNDGELAECNRRFNSIASIRFNSRQEDVNRIVDLGLLSQNDVVNARVSFDINTLQGNNDVRFIEADMPLFIDAVNALLVSIFHDFEEV